MWRRGGHPEDKMRRSGGGEGERENIRRREGDEQELSLLEKGGGCACQLWGCILPHTGVHTGDVHASMYLSTSYYYSTCIGS